LLRITDECILQQRKYLRGNADHLQLYEESLTLLGASAVALTAAEGYSL
jgi:hypothetical protein